MRQLCLAVCLVSVPALSGCSPTVLQCRLDAVESAVPADPGLITADDIIAVVQRLEACKATVPDGGIPK